MGKIFHYFRQSLFSSRLDKLIRPVSKTMLRIVYTEKFIEWCRENIDPARVFETKYDLYPFIIEQHGLNNDIDYLEFGVWQGQSLIWWANNISSPDARFIGFDTFTGLPEDWTKGLRKGAFSTQGKTPDIKDSRVSYEVGIFQDTLEPFLQKNTLERRLIINLDADMYSSTLYVLTTIATRLKQGDIIFLDEASAVTHEFRALTDFLNAYKVKVRAIGATQDYERIALEII